jgi:hypothetical protein
LTKFSLRRIRTILKGHHSRDHQFIANIQEAMDSFPDENSEYYPWKCPCGRLNKKWASQCAICYGPWTAGVRHRTQPKPYNWQETQWEDWQDASWQGATSRSTSRATSYRNAEPSPSPHHRANQQKPIGRGKGAGKGKLKGKKGMHQGKGQETVQTSPFQVEEAGFASWHSLDASKFMPTSELAPSPFAAITATSSSPDLEWIEHLKKAYPDPSTMPEDTKMLIEKADRENGRVGIKNLHQATKYLGKAKKHLAEVTEQQRAHRSQWMAHLAAGISMWESQLKDFRKHQTLLTAQANRARTEIPATHKIIHQLSSQAAGGTNPPNLPAPSPTEVEDLTEDAVDKDEDALRQKLQGVLKRCAGSLGLEILGAKPEEVMEEDEKEEATDKPPKRQRSLEPFATTPK